MASSKQDNYLLVAAIDFGTTYSGYAYSTRADFIRDPTRAHLKQWVDPSSSMMCNKTSTCILFDKYKRFSHFGFEAEAKYQDLLLDKEHKDWYFFRRFKMSLYNKQSSLHDMCIEDEGGKALPALLVFSESIKYLKQSLIEEAKKQQTDIGMDDIKWILTVPAIWSDPAKAFMRRAAVEIFDFGSILYTDKVYHCGSQQDSSSPRASGNWDPADSRNGGTIDITAHEVLSDGCVRELISANGGNWGGTSVDDEFMDFIKCLIGDSATRNVQQNAPHILFEICREFEIAKRLIKPKSGQKCNVRIPSQLAEIYAKFHKGTELKSNDTVLTKRDKIFGISFVGDKLRLASNDAEEFFTESVKAIYLHLKELLRKKSGKGIETIILVGGYAESQMLIQTIKSIFSEMRIIIPHEASWSVLRGAVIFGHDPSLIRERRSKYTYGIRVWRKFDPSQHDEKYKGEKDGETICNKLFSKLVGIDDPVTVGEYQYEKAYNIQSIGSQGNFSLYSSESNNPKYIDEKGCFFLGHILPKGHKFHINETVNVMLRFGETEIEIKVHQPKTQNTAFFYLEQ